MKFWFFALLRTNTERDPRYSHDYCLGRNVMEFATDIFIGLFVMAAIAGCMNSIARVGGLKTAPTILTADTPPAQNHYELFPNDLSSLVKCSSDDKNR